LTAAEATEAAPEATLGTWSLILHCCKNFSVCRVLRVRRSWIMVINSGKMDSFSGCWGSKMELSTIFNLFWMRINNSGFLRPGRSNDKLMQKLKSA
jgi:hypothetical protein